jgi:hypothetical protein
MASRPNLRLARRAAPVALLAGILLLAAACTAPALPGTQTAERGVGVNAERGPDSPATQEPAVIASPAAGPQPSTATASPGAAIEPAPTTATPQAGTGTACPSPTDDLQRLVDPVHGYCLAYPAEYKVEKPNPSWTALVIGGGLNAVDPRAHITVTDAQGKTLEEAAQRMEAEYNVGFDPKRSQTTVAGEPAVVFDGLTGEDVNRRVLFVHDGLLYHLYFAPSDPANADVYGRLETLYKQVIGSFTFIPRSAAAVDDCLSPSSTTRLLSDRERGFCLLYPADFTLNESADGTLALAAGSPGGDNRSKVVIEVKDAGGKTAEQLADELVAEAQRATPGLSVDRPFGLTIGYDAAQLLEGVPGPELSRHVLAVHNGKLYHLTFTPADPSEDKAYAQMQALYDLVVRSFRFITPGS